MGVMGYISYGAAQLSSRHQHPAGGRKQPVPPTTPQGFRPQPRARIGTPQPTQVGELKARAKLTEDVGDDIIVMFKYSVHEGREEEAEKYFWAALNQ